MQYTKIYEAELIVQDPVLPVVSPSRAVLTGMTKHIFSISARFLLAANVFIIADETFDVL